MTAAFIVHLDAVDCAPRFTCRRDDGTVTLNLTGDIDACVYVNGASDALRAFLVRLIDALPADVIDVPMEDEIDAAEPAEPRDENTEVHA